MSVFGVKVILILVTMWLINQQFLHRLIFPTESPVCLRKCHKDKFLCIHCARHKYVAVRPIVMRMSK